MRDPLATNQQKTKYKSYFHHVVIVYRKHTKLNTSKESLKKKSKKEMNRILVVITFENFTQNIKQCIQKKLTHTTSPISTRAIKERQ